MNENKTNTITSKSSLDYLNSKDAYDSKMDSPKPIEPLPESKRPRKDGPGGA